MRDSFWRPLLQMAAWSALCWGLLFAWQCPGPGPRPMELQRGTERGKEKRPPRAADTPADCP
jgi:hypothetical protein